MPSGEDRREVILSLAVKIDSLLGEHPIPFEAEAASAIAQQLAHVRTQSASFIRVQSAPLPESILRCPVLEPIPDSPTVANGL